MAIRDILVCLDASAAGEGRLRVALGIARAQRASVTGVFVVSGAKAPPGLLGVGPLPQGDSETSGSAGFGVAVTPEAGPPREAVWGEQAELRFAAELQAAGIDGEWHLLDDGDTAALIDYTKAADLAVLAQQSTDSRRDGAAMKLRPDDIVVEVGRPVIVVPYAGTFETVGRRVLVAWDGTREATRALNDALPLLDDAEAVTVLYVGTQETQLEKTRPAIDRIVRHLERHAIKAHAEESLKGDMAISDLLLSRAADLDADMIVAGAYHHSPLREALLGGVSRELLRHMTVPVLMSH